MTMQNDTAHSRSNEWYTIYKTCTHLLTDEEVEAYFEMTKVIFMGTPDFSTKVLEMLIEEHDVIAVVTQP